MDNTIQNLKDLKKSLNAAIDNYIQLAEKSSDPQSLEAAKLKLDHEASKISANTSDAAAACFTQSLQPALNAAIRTAIDLHLFELVKSSTPLDELASTTGAERELLVRIMRMCSTVHFFTELSPETYGPSPKGNAMCIPGIRDYFKLSFDTNMKYIHVLPEVLAANNYRDPQDLETNAAMRALGGVGLFEYLGANPERQAVFDSAMSLQEHMPETTIPYYRFDAPNIGEGVAIVDVGGGRGQYLMTLREDFPDLEGRFILQDLPNVVKTMSEEEVVAEITAHDFFTPQPVQGARWYHLRRVLHDWPDESVKTILGHLAKACKKGHSTILIHEWILPDMNCPPDLGMMDMVMACLCGKERSIAQWSRLLEAVGLEIVGTYMAKEGRVGILECALV